MAKKSRYMGYVNAMKKGQAAKPVSSVLIADRQSPSTIPLMATPRWAALWVL